MFDYVEVRLCDTDNGDNCGFCGLKLEDGDNVIALLDGTVEKPEEDSSESDADGSDDCNELDCSDDLGTVYLSDRELRAIVYCEKCSYEIYNMISQAAGRKKAEMQSTLTI